MSAPSSLSSSASASASSGTGLSDLPLAEKKPKGLVIGPRDEELIAELDRKYDLLQRGYSKAEILEKILHVNSYNKEYNVDTIQISQTLIQRNPVTYWRKGDNPGPEIYETSQPYGMLETWYSSGDNLHRIYRPADSKCTFDGKPIVEDGFGME
jgi:hypothetical protein